jgi:hypothetical protein
VLSRLLAGMLLLFALVPVGSAGSAPPTPQPQYLVVIVMDGFRPDYLSLAPMRHLHWLMQRGMSYGNAWVGQLESETPTGHATIATGVYPRKHGIIGFGWRNVQTGNFDYAPTDLDQIGAGVLTKIMEQDGVPTLSDLIHARHRGAVAVSISGEKYYAAATMGAGADYIFYGADQHNRFVPVSIGPNIPPASSRYKTVSEPDSTLDLQDPFAASLAVQLARTMRPRALLLNLPGTDIAGHYYGGMKDTADMRPIVEGADAAIGRVIDAYRALGMLNRTLFVVTADHGMAANGHIVPIHAMYNAVAHGGYPYLDEEYRITLGSIWLRDPRGAASVAAAMDAKHFSGIEGALYKVQSPTGYAFRADPATAGHLPAPLVRAYLDLADTEAAASGPEVLLPYAEDTTGLIVKNRTLWGSHGGFSWGVQHIPLVLAGPGVRHGVSSFPAKLVDIAPTIERLLGLDIPSGVDGVVLANALQHASAAERTAQNRVSRTRMSDETAIRLDSVRPAVRP